MKDGGTHNWLFDWFHYGLDRKCPQDQDLFSRVIKAMDRQECLSGPYYGSNYENVHSELLAMWYHPRKGLHEERGFPLPLDFDELVETSGLGRFDHKNVEIIPLKEPLKIRTISKGNALKYWLAKPVQKTMRDLIRKFPQMALTGGPLTEDHLRWLWSETESLKQRIAPFCPDLDLDFTHVVSGDYKGATDGIDIRATKLAFEIVLSSIKCPAHYNTEETRERWKQSLRDVLYEQLLHYPESEHGGPDTTQQTNGQLMGSNLSFPILCVINLVGYWLTLEEYTGLQIEPNKLPVLINGDDILFRTPKPRPDVPNSFYELWKKNVSTLGFELSVGKNYIHSTILTVNSECWVVSGDEQSPSFRRVRHLNVGLLTNNNAAARLESRVLPLSERIEEVLEGAHDKHHAWRRLKHYYRDELKTWMQVGRHTTFNVFAAIPLGGLGVDTHGVDPQYTGFQRRMASYLRKKYLNMTSSDELRSYEMIALTTDKEGEGLSYAVPQMGRGIQWVDPALLVEQSDLKLTKDVRSLPVLSREQAITRSSWVKKFSTRSLKSFQKALQSHIVSSDTDPGKFGLVLAKRPEQTDCHGETPDSLPVSYPSEADDESVINFCLE